MFTLFKCSNNNDDDEGGGDDGRWGDEVQKPIQSEAFEKPIEKVRNQKRKKESERKKEMR